MEDRALLLGLISDTHGYFDPRLPDIFRGVERILHAGDIGGMEMINLLAEIAPVVAVHGNSDRGFVVSRFPLRQDITIDGVSIHLAHRLEDATSGPRVVVYGHTHEPSVAEKGGILYINPGVAGRTRYPAGRSVALLRVDGGEARAEIIALGPE